jgi:hypothetical protein
VDKAKDAVGVGPHSSTGYHNQPGYDNYGNPRQEGIVDRAKDVVGMGPNSGTGYNNQSGYDSYGNPRHEGMLDKASDAVGMGPNSGTGYNNRPGYDTYGDRSHEGIGDKVRDPIGTGPNSGYDSRTPTGTDAYVHGNHPPGMQDRITGVNEPSILGGRENVDRHGFGHDGRQHHGLLDNVPLQGDHIPETMVGERRVEPGYDMTKSAGHHLTDLGHHGHDSSVTGLDHHGHDSGVTGLGHHDTDYVERRGKGFEDPIDNKTRLGSDYDTTETGSGYGATDTDAAPHKKGIITKIKEKLHH